MVDFDQRAGRIKRLVLGDLLHRQDRPARNVVLVENFHRLELGLGHGPGFDTREDLVEMRQALGWRRIVRISLPTRLADHIANLLPDGSLGDEIEIGVRIVFPTLALENTSRLTATGIITGTWHGIPERNSLAVLAIFLHRTAL